MQEIRNRVSKVAVATAGLAVALAVVTSAAYVALDDSYIHQHLAAQRTILTDAHAREEAVERLVRFGMEPGTCGFHVVEPPRFQFQRFSSSNITGDVNGYWNFHIIPAGIESVYFGQLGQELPTVLASTERAFPNVVAHLERVPTSFGWGVRATFSVKGMSVVSLVHGPANSASPFTDWYGMVHLNGGDSSIMTVALVCDNEALLPFSVTDLAGLPGPRTVMVADKLSKQEADDLIAAYESS